MSQTASPPAARVIWLANLATPLVLGVVAQLMLSGESPVPFVTPNVLAILVLVAVGLLGLGFRIRGWMRTASEAESSEGSGAVAPHQIVPWAIFEAIAILGFVAVFGGASPAYFWLFAVFSWVGLMLTRP